MKQHSKAEGIFHARSAEEVKAAVQEWDLYVHQRARDFFGSQEVVERVLEKIARYTTKDSNPVYGSAERCVLWHGQYTEEDAEVEGERRKPHAVLEVYKPADGGESNSHVSRVMAFLFASDESFEQLMKLPKDPFSMCCNNQLCVNLAHIMPAITPCTCSNVTAVTLHHLPGVADRVRISCVSMSGMEIARFDVNPATETLGDIRAALAQRTPKPKQSLRLLLPSGELLIQDKETDDMTLAALLGIK